MSGHWRLEPDQGAVVVTAVAPTPPAPAYLWQPRVSPKVGLGLPLDRVPSLVHAIAGLTRSSQGENPWSAPGIDHTEGFVYLHGPVGALVPVTGYQPLERFVVAMDDLFGLGRRLAVLNGRL